MLTLRSNGARPGDVDAVEHDRARRSAARSRRSSAAPSSCPSRDGPSSVRNSPSRMSRSTPSTACTASEPEPKVLRRSRSRTAGSVMAGESIAGTVVGDTGSCEIRTDRYLIATDCVVPRRCSPGGQSNGRRAERSARSPLARAEPSPPRPPRTGGRRRAVPRWPGRLDDVRRRAPGVARALQALDGAERRYPDLDAPAR